MGERRGPADGHPQAGAQDVVRVAGRHQHARLSPSRRSTEPATADSACIASCTTARATSSMVSEAASAAVTRCSRSVRPCSRSALARASCSAS